MSLLSSSTAHESHLPKLLSQVRRMAQGFSRRLPPSVQLDDLVAAGNLGLATALRRFEGADGSAFEAFAMVHARGAILDELRRVDPMSRAGRSLARRSQSVKAVLSTRLGRDPDDNEVAGAMKLSIDEYRDLQARMTHVTVEASTSDGASGRDVTVVPDDSMPVDERLDEARAKHRLARQIERLPPRHAKVIELSYGHDKTLDSIAQVLGVSVARAGQLRLAAVGKLHAACANENAACQAA